MIRRAGPHVQRRLIHLCGTTDEAAPLVAIFDEWAPRTSIPRSIVTVQMLGNCSTRSFVK